MRDWPMGSNFKHRRLLRGEGVVMFGVGDSQVKMMLRGREWGESKSQRLFPARCLLVSCLLSFHKSGE